MTKDRLIEQCSVLGMLAALGASFWRPEASWPFGLMLGSVAVGAIVTKRLRTPAELRRTRYWLAPTILFLMAAQFAFIGRPEDRPRLWLYAAILAVAGAALLIVRRPRP